jgi:hypothetical protein
MGQILLQKFFAVAIKNSLAVDANTRPARSSFELVRVAIKKAEVPRFASGPAADVTM